MPEKSIPIFICAGDPSGDIAGYHLIKELQTNYDNPKIFGLGGNRMRSAGQEQVVEGNQLAVLGFYEVAKKYFFFRKLMYDTIDLIEKTKPKIIILIDYPGFNLRLAERIKKLGIPIIYYISPQIWAWAPKRINQIKKLIDLMLLILPFETDIYNRAGVKNKFVGHYLLDDMDKKYIKAPYDPESKLITLLPGSRPQEIQRMLPVLLESAEILAKQNDYRFAIAAVDGNIDYEKYLNRCSINVEIIKGKSREMIHQSRLVITSSGTATLETGIIGRPMVVIYKTGLLTYLIAKNLVKVNNIALINIVSAKTIVPELIQNEATATNIVRAANKFLENKQEALNTIALLNKTIDQLGGTGCAKTAVTAIGEFLNC